MFHSLCGKIKVTRQCPQIAIFEAIGEPKRNQTEVFLLTMQPHALPLGQNRATVTPTTYRREGGGYIY